MRISARNQVPGTVRSVREGAVMAEIVVVVVGEHEVVSLITAESARHLGLQPGRHVVARTGGGPGRTTGLASTGRSRTADPGNGEWLPGSHPGDHAQRPASRPASERSTKP